MANSPAPAGRHQPVQEIRLGAVKAAIWQNDTDSSVRFNVTFQRLYREGETWKSTDSFGRDDLLLLAKIADRAHSWILEQIGAATSAPSATASVEDTALTDKRLPKRPSVVKGREPGA